MAGVNTDPQTLRNDRFELVAILRTLLKENIVLASVLKRGTISNCYVLNPAVFI